MIYEKKINGVNFTLVCESYSNYRAWGHIVTLYKNGVQIAREKIRYYNRTWESYQYQTCIKNCIYQVISAVKNAIKAEFKRVNDYKVITAKRAAALDRYMKQNKEYKQITRLYSLF